MPDSESNSWTFSVEEDDGFEEDDGTKLWEDHNHAVAAEEMIACVQGLSDKVLALPALPPGLDHNPLPIGHNMAVAQHAEDTAPVVGSVAVAPTSAQLELTRTPAPVALPQPPEVKKAAQTSTPELARY